MKKSSSYIIVPGFDSSSHRALYEKICMELNCTELILTPLKQYYRPTLILRSIYTLIKSLPSLIKCMLRKDIRLYSFDGQNFGRSINEEGLSRSSIGRFSIFDNGLYYIFKANIIYNIIMQLFKTHNIKMIIGGDDAYILFGLLSQTAIKEDIPVFFIKGMTNITLRGYDIKYYTSAPPYEELYEQYKDNLSDKVLDFAEKRLIERCNGDKASLSFMPRERYESRLKLQDEPSIIMFLHDLFDSPGIYGSNLFKSHVDWIESTIGYLKNKKLKFYIKTHPNEREISKNLSSIILNKHKKDIEIIDKDISLVELKKTQVRAILTVVGTVAIEAGYIGIPVIAAGRSPYSCGSNIRVPKNISEYFGMIELAIQNKLAIPDRREAIVKEALNNILNWYLPTIENISFNDITQQDWNQSMKFDYPSTLYERRKHYMGSKNFYKYLKNKYIGINFTNDGNFNVLSKALVKTN